MPPRDRILPFGRNPREGNLTIRKFFTPTSAKFLVQDVIMIHALIKLWLSSMVYQLCIFLNYKVFRILQRDLSTIRQDSVIYRQCRMHSIGYLWSFVFATKLLWYLQGYSKSRVSVFKLSDLINLWQCTYYNLWCNVGGFLQDPSAKFLILQLCSSLKYTDS